MDSVPFPIIVEICCYLDGFKDLIRFSGISKRYFNLRKEDSLWKKFIFQTSAYSYHKGNNKKNSNQSPFLKLKIYSR